MAYPIVAHASVYSKSAFTSLACIKQVTIENFNIYQLEQSSCLFHSQCAALLGGSTIFAAAPPDIKGLTLEILQRARGSWEEKNKGSRDRKPDGWSWEEIETETGNEGARQEKEKGEARKQTHELTEINRQERGGGGGGRQVHQPTRLSGLCVRQQLSLKRTGLSKCQHSLERRGYALNKICSQ